MLVVPDVSKDHSGSMFRSKHFNEHEECLEYLTLNTKVLQPFISSVTTIPTLQRHNPEDLNPGRKFRTLLLTILVLRYTPLVRWDGS